ncbi:uncharacterized protein [Ptychodera flava]|uniref:uncharacterized protein n=1 Tax=Ptychodera flava TaxID=63121 RepID=UPI00396A6407
MAQGQPIPGRSQEGARPGTPTYIHSIIDLVPANLTTRESESMVQKCSSLLPSISDTEEVKDVKDVIKRLYKSELLGPDNIHLLKFLLKAVEREDLIEKVLRIEDHSPSKLPWPQQESAGSSYPISESPFGERFASPGIMFSPSGSPADHLSTWPRNQNKAHKVLLEYMRAPNPLFLGQDDVINKIRNSYEQKRPERDSLNPMESTSVVHVINGLPGSGKTEIAIQYVKKNFDLYPSGIIWITAESMNTMDYGFKHMCKTLSLTQTTDFNAFSIRSAITKWLENNVDWLMVLDNADSADVINKYFPKFPDGGHVIIASRDTKFGRKFGVTPFCIKPLPQEVAAQLLFTGVHAREGEWPENTSRQLRKARASISQLEKEDKENYYALLWLAGPDGLDGLPLALNAAIKYMTLNKRSFKDYKGYYLTCFEEEIFQHFKEEHPLKEWLKKYSLSEYFIPLSRKVQKSMAAFLDLTEQDLTSDDINMTDNDAKTFIHARMHNIDIEKWMLERQSVITTWSLTFNSIEETENGQETMELLQLCAFLSPTISEELFVKGANHLENGTLKNAMLQKVTSKHGEEDRIRRNLDKILLSLRRYSLVGTTKEDATSPSRYQQSKQLTIHRILQEVIKLQLESKNRIHEVVSHAIVFLTRWIPSEDKMRQFHSGPKTLPGLIEELALHAIYLNRSLPKLLVERKAPLENPIQLLNSIGLYLRHIKWRPVEAVPLYETALAAAEMITDESNEEPASKAKLLGDAHFHLSSSLLEAKEEDKMLEHLRTARDFYMKSCPEKEHDSNIDIAKVYYVEASSKDSLFVDRKFDSLEKSGMDDVFAMLDKAIAISEKHYERQKKRCGVWTAVAMHTLGVFHLQRKPLALKFEDIEKILSESLAMKKECWNKNGDKDHISIAIGMTDLGRLYLVWKNKSKYEDAENLLLEGLKMKERLLPEYKNFDTWKIGVYLLRRLYMVLGNEGKAEQYKEILHKAGGDFYDRYLQEDDPFIAFPMEPLLWV